MTKGNLRIVIIALSVLVFFGGLYILKNSTSGNKSEDNNVESSNQQENEIKDNYYYTTVDNLSVRRYPSLDAKRISSLDEGVRVTYLGSESANVIGVKLRGKQTTGPFYFIRTDSGKEGWVYSGALSSTPVYVEDYEAIVVFSEYVEKLDGDESEYALTAVSDLYDEIKDYLNKNNRRDIKLVLKTDDFDEVNIRNSDGKIIDVENIRKIVKEDKYGFVMYSSSRDKSEVVTPVGEGEYFAFYKLCEIKEFFRLRYECETW